MSLLARTFEITITQDHLQGLAVGMAILTVLFVVLLWSA